MHISALFLRMYCALWASQSVLSVHISLYEACCEVTVKYQGHGRRGLHHQRSSNVAEVVRFRG